MILSVVYPIYLNFHFNMQSRWKIIEVLYFFYTNPLKPSGFDIYKSSDQPHCRGSVATWTQGFHRDSTVLPGSQDDAELRPQPKCDQHGCKWEMSLFCFPEASGYGWCLLLQHHLICLDDTHHISLNHSLGVELKPFPGFFTINKMPR